MMGGRDINPKEYGEELNGSKVFPEARVIFNHFKCVLDNLKPQTPVFGICMSFEILNVYMKGSLVQDQGEETNKAHANKIMYIDLDSNSWVGGVLGPKVKGWCFHHQALKELGLGLKISARSPDGVIHGVEFMDGPYF